MKNLFRRLIEFDAHHRVAVALVVAALTFGISSRWLRLPMSLIVAWDAFALCSLGLAWAGMIFTDARTRVREAHLQDSSRAAICGCVVLAAVASLFGAGLLLGSAKGLAGGEVVSLVTPPGEAGALQSPGGKGGAVSAAKSKPVAGSKR